MDDRSPAQKKNDKKKDGKETKAEMEPLPKVDLSKARVKSPLGEMS
jgi:hypothetical protein